MSHLPRTSPAASPATTDLSELEALIRELGDSPRALAALATLKAVERELTIARQTEARVLDITRSLLALAAFDLSRLPATSDDGSTVDAAASSVRLLAEQLRGRFEEHARVEQDLEAVVRQRSEQLLQAGKMAAVGQLAAGIAHEVNNPLAVILAFAQGIERRLPEIAPQLQTPVASIIRETHRCRKIVEELLTFSRINRRGREPLFVDALLWNASALLAPCAREQGTQLHFDIAEGMPQVLGDRVQLEQVFINLGINALDAVAQGGTVSFAVRQTPTSVTLSVTDDGPGIPPDVLPRSFEPFFTTKPQGRGTGLGLSLSYEIVRQHQGTLEVETELGRGTTLLVRLPPL